MEVVIAFCILMGFVLILTIIQLIIVFKQTIYTYKHKEITQTDKVMIALSNGTIKKHLLRDNTKTEYNSTKNLIKYKEFLKSNLYKDIMKLQDKPYVG